MRDHRGQFSRVVPCTRGFAVPSQQHIVEESPQAVPAEALFTKAFSWLDHYLGPTV
jgi:hypothetical protein